MQGSTGALQLSQIETHQSGTPTSPDWNALSVVDHLYTSVEDQKAGDSERIEATRGNATSSALGGFQRL